MSVTEFHFIDRSNFKPNKKKRDRDDHLDLNWATGFFKNGRPFRTEYWAAHQVTYLVYYFSTKGLEDLEPIDIKNLLVSENLIEFDDELYHGLGGFSGINLSAEKIKDASGSELWEATIIAGDDDGAYIKDKARLRRHKNWRI